MKYSTKVAIIPYDRYERLCENKTQTDVHREAENAPHTSHMNENVNGTSDPELSSSSNAHTELDVSRDINSEKNINQAIVESDQSKNNIAQESKEISKYDEIISRLPKYLHNRAITLLNFISDKTPITWNSEGELIINQETITGSHIVDLLKDALSNSSFTPIGYDIFYKNLGNIPRSLIYNTKRRYLLGFGEGNIENISSQSSPPPGLPNKPEINLDEYIEGQKWRKLWKKKS